MKQAKTPQVNKLVICGAVMVFFSCTPAKGPLTRALNIICGLGGAGLVLVGSIQEIDRRNK